MASPGEAPIKYGNAASRRWADIANFLTMQTGELESSAKKAKTFTRAAAGRRLDRSIIAKRGIS